MYEFHTFMRLLWEELHDWGWTIQHPDTFIFYILCQQVEKYRFIQLKWVQSSCFQYGNGLRSPMKLRKARHLRRCDRPGRCRPSWPLQEPWRSHQIHPSKKGGPGWVAVSNMLVKGGCHEVACVDVLRGINEKGYSKQKNENLPLFWSSTFFSVLLISIFKVPFLGSRSWTQLDWILVQLFSDYRS